MPNFSRCAKEISETAYGIDRTDPSITKMDNSSWYPPAAASRDVAQGSGTTREKLGALGTSECVTWFSKTTYGDFKAAKRVGALDPRGALEHRRKVASVRKMSRGLGDICRAETADSRRWSQDANAGTQGCQLMAR
jgi:hypothetical protein